MKKVISGLLVFVFSIGIFSTVASAKENVVYEDENFVVSTSDNNLNSGVGEFIIPKENLSKFRTNSTAIGSGGKATLNASDDRRRIYWSVKPKTWGPWWFEGTLKLRYRSGFKRNVHLSGYGVLGSTYSEYVPLNKNNGGRVYLSGKAVDAFGSTYGVLPNFSIAF
ncbi:hypothetical protein KHO97_03560 [Bacillus licheniformis]|uniref:hypothetical protein n=1 Tax=Bacillus licheniformis TaxID=1402 RepID=UPI0008BBD391|nr:hypothetical protein [Bacillus licheniformis]MBT1249466.1 hypothetical protein [Bacillus licheniformis]MCY9236813.1 hypothetical protein [Bacillus licheniformis]MED1523896.1 hypothetical protein [Bacillus licheniformis]MED4930348.1 hypothetical protein [Bacillus licheniformis]OLO19341.1 hypothetical protein BKP29_0208625 [Bacillus licheniformis]